MSVTLTRRCFTVDEYHRMGEAGILHEDERIELIDGEIVQMAAVGGRHIACVIRLDEWLNPRVRETALVSVQNPVRLSEHSEPEPDLAILRRRNDYYAAGPPEPADVLFLIEVADSSLAYDRDTKVPLYAAAGIPEVWLVDLEHERVTVYRTPVGGAYQDVTVHLRGAALSPLAFPDLSITVDEILG